jgi:hypothetical protein
MTNAPERIWAWPWTDRPNVGQWGAQGSGDDVEYIRADLCQPKVKPLVWEEATGRDNPAMIEAKTVTGKYEILQDPTSGWLFDVWFYGETEFHIGSFADDEAAKSAAEAHHAARALDLRKQLFEVTE